MKLQATVTGPEDAPAVLLLHGFPQTGHCWRGVLPHLEGLRCVVPDQRGYSTPRPTAVEDYAMPHLVADALELLDDLGVAQAHVVGHDWGASVAWHLAARHPERVRRLTALSVPHPRAFLEALMTDDDQRARSPYMRDFSRPGYDQVLLADDAAGLRAAFGGIPAVDAEVYVERAKEPGALNAWLSWYAAQKREHSEDTPAVTVPTLHVWSTEDPALGRRGTELTAQWVTGPYELRVLEGVSHWVPEEAADVVGPWIRAHEESA